MASKKVFYATVILIFVVAGGVSIYLFSKQVDSQFSQISNYSSGGFSQYYIACGCGCCGGAAKEVCIYNSKGDSLQAIMEEDQKAAQNPKCAFMECNNPVKYVYCD